MPESWQAYHDLTRDSPPREQLVRAVDFVGEKKNAIDLGAGALNETRFLLDQGFKQVVALDREPLRDADAASLPTDRFRYIRSAFEDFQFPERAFDLVNAQYSLPFIRPTQFNRVFIAVRRSVSKGGVFAGQLFGNRDEWAWDRTMNFHNRRRAMALFDGMELIEFEEEDQDGDTADGAPKHWHVFHVIARKA